MHVIRLVMATESLICFVTLQFVYFIYWVGSAAVLWKMVLQPLNISGTALRDSILWFGT